MYKTSSSSPIIGILGGGIAGLTSAYYLAQKCIRIKYPQLRILLLERSSRFGGWIHSSRLDEKYHSHLFEHGPRTLRLQSGIASLNSHAAINTLQLLKQLNIFDSQVSPIEKISLTNKNKLIYYNRQLINLNDLSLIIGGKPLRYPPVIYALYEYFSNKGRQTVQDETIKSFIYRRFGDILAEDIVEYLLDPLLKGVYAGSVNNLSARSVMKKIFQLEQRYGSILNGLLKTRNNKNKDDTIDFLFKDLNLEDYSSILNKYSIYYLKDGLEILIQTLVEYLQTLSNVKLIHNEIIEKIHFHENQIEILTRTNQIYHIDHLISALPSYELAKYINDDILCTRLNQIPFVNMIVINLLYQRDDIYPKEAFGYLIPSREHSYLLGVIFDTCIRYSTDKNKHGSQLTVMLGGVWFDELRLGQCTDEQLMHIVMNELKKQMNLDEKPLFYKINRLNQAIPNYNVGHHNILDDIYTIIRDKKYPLTLVGQSYRGIGISDVIYDARVEMEYLNLEKIQNKQQETIIV